MNKLALRKLFCVALFCAINFSVSLASTQVIEKFEKAPFIDGIVSMEEWGLPHMELKNYNMFTFPNGANKVELDGYSYFGYDNKHIYMAIAAKYDEHNNNYSDFDLGLGDSLIIQISVDGTNDRRVFCFGLGQDDKVLGYQENYATYEQETSGGEFFVKWDEKLNVMTYEIALPISWLSDTVNSFNEKDTIALSFALRMHNGYIYEWYGGIVNRSDIKKAALFTLGKEKNMPDDSNFKVFCDRVKKLLQGENFFGLKNYKKLSMPFSTKYKSKNTFSPVSYKSGNSFLDIETIKNENTINNQLQYFVFTTENNKYLPFNISCNVEENLITAMLPAGIDCSNLIPAFVVKDGDLLIDNEKIQSGVTSIDFNDEVTLILQSYTGEKKEINVSLETLDTGLPSVAMTTENYDEIVSKEEYLNASVYVGGGAQKDPILIDAKVKGRGNTSWLSPKKSFRIKLDEKVNLLGMSTSKDWVLISNWLDKTLLRNAMAEYLAEGAGVEYVMKNHPVDLWYNGQYHGTYNLTEKIELEEERVNITEYEENLDGSQIGYILEFDLRTRFSLWDEENSKIIQTPLGDKYKVYYNPITDELFMQIGRRYITISEPSTKKLLNDVEKIRYIYNRLYEASDALNSGDFQKISQCIDVNAFCRWYIVAEFMNNQDSNLHTSCFCTLDKNGKFKMGPVWDFDRSSDNNPDYNKSEQINFLFNIFRRIFSFKETRDILKEEYKNFRPTLDNLTNHLTYMANKIYASQEYNFERWPIITTDLHNNYIENKDFYAECAKNEVFYNDVIIPRHNSQTYEAEIAKLIAYFNRRTKAMDQFINDLK